MKTKIINLLSFFIKKFISGIIFFLGIIFAGFLFVFASSLSNVNDGETLTASTLNGIINWINNEGASKVYVDSKTNNIYSNGGNIGIGIENPSSKFEVKGGSTILEQQAWQIPTLQNGWVDYGSGWQTSRYFKDSLGMVHISGLVRNGTIGSIIFTLPIGYRPGMGLHFPAINATGDGSISSMGFRINSLGQITCTTGCGNTWVSLDSIYFMAEQ